LLLQSQLNYFTERSSPCILTKVSSKT